VVDEFGAVLGTRDPDTLVVEGNLAVVYVGLQRFDQGLDLLSRNVESRRLVLGDTHPETLRSRHALATAYQMSERLPEALCAFVT
jgi:hypothetical protein